MFFKNILYEMKLNIRAKEVLIWMVIFPICLGLFYKFAFGNLGKDMDPVKVAIVENTEDTFLHMMESKINGNSDEAEETTEDGEKKDQKPMLDPTYCTEEEAYKLLDDGDVAGIIIVDPVEGQTAEPSSDDTAMMTEVFGADWDRMEDFTQIGDRINSVPEGTADMSGLMDTMKDKYLKDTKISVKVKKNGQEQSTLKSYVEMILDMKNMADGLWDSKTGEDGKGNAFDNIDDVINGAVIKEVPLTEGNKDPLAMYMYNLIAMVSIFGSLAAMHIAINNQANLSPMGMRRSCAGTPKSMVVLPGLIGTYITHSACVLISITFLKFALQIDFGDKLLLVYLTGICGAIMGVSLGFFVGAIGKLSEGAKTGLMMAVNMSLCFMSGLMIDAIRAIFSVQVPIVNDLNPVAVVADAMYYLNMDADLSRYFGKLLVMGGFTVAFIVLGILMTRRKLYKQLS
ncbi:MAG: ABC transporter permease [Eubacterium sp.]|nr:ABC transporter permease [Eubacterium sp.]